MQRSQLQNKYFRNRTRYNLNAYKHQRNFCARLCKKEKKDYYSNIQLCNVTDNKRFWKTVKPILSDKGINNRKIILKSNENIITEDEEVANSMNLFFENAVSSLNIKENSLLLSQCKHLENPIEKIIKKYEVHPSILTIKENVNVINSFEFSKISSEQVLSEINKIDAKKVGTYLNIPAKILKKASNVIVNYLTAIWNDQIVGQNTFQDELKLAEITPIF